MLYNPLDKFYKSHTGAVCARVGVTFRIKGDFNSVLFVLKKDGEEFEEYIAMSKCDGYFELTRSFDKGLYFYCFSIDDGRYIGKGEDTFGILTQLPNKYQLTVYSENYEVPDIISGGVIYQIFPDRFYRGNKLKPSIKGKILRDDWNGTPIFEPNEQGQVMNNDFFGGDLKGIEDKLPYLSKLGVTAIYLNPIFKAYSNHRYDTGNYMEIDQLLGTIDDFKSLISSADKYGIKLILDGVFNHTGDDSIYFNRYGNYNSVGAYQSKDSKYFSWYNFIDYPNKYDAWWGIKTLPAVNESNEDYLEYITGENGVISHYTKLGVGGWRLDVVDELPTEFVRKIRQAVKRENKNAIIIGEVWEDASNKIAYGVRREYFQGLELDSVMNYPLKNAIIDFVRNGNVDNLLKVIYEQIDHYPQMVLHSLMNILSTHDTMRLITAVAGKDLSGASKKEMSVTSISKDDLPKAKLMVKVASLLQYTLCGVPCIYYGDETGMQGYIDPLNRRCYPWGSEDDELVSWYEFLGRLRKEYSALKNGSYETLYSAKGAIVFKRFDDDSELLVAVNVGDKDLCLEYDGTLINLIDNTEQANGFMLEKGAVSVMVKNLTNL